MEWYQINNMTWEDLKCYFSPYITINDFPAIHSNTKNDYSTTLAEVLFCKVIHNQFDVIKKVIYLSIAAISSNSTN